MKHSYDTSAPHLQFGHSSKAHYKVPVGYKTLDATLGNPHELTERTHGAFDRQVLMQLQVKLQRTVNALLQNDLDLATQDHVQPDLRVYQPGTYTTVQEGSLSQRLESSTQHTHRVYLQFGGYKFESVFPSPACDMRTTRRAVNRLLEQILDSVETDELAKTPEMTLETVHS